MKRRTRFIPGLLAAAVAVFGLAACETEPESDGLEFDQPADTAGALDQQTGQMPEEIYEATIEGVNGQDITGRATVTVRDDELQVVVAATGLEPDTRVPQHIHVNATCDDAGGILLNLDDGLTGPNEGEPRGDAYPETDSDGRLEYEASRSLEDLRTAVQQDAQQATADTAQAGQQPEGTTSRAAQMDLGNRVVNIHGPDMQPIACGALERSGMTTGTGTTGTP